MSSERIERDLVMEVSSFLDTEGKAGEEVVRRRMHGGEIRRHPRCAVPDGELQLDADAPRAPAAQRGEETRVERGGGCRFLLHVPHHCTIRRPTADNRKWPRDAIGEPYFHQAETPRRRRTVCQ